MISSEDAAIVCSCKQTRFHIENPNYRELDIENLSLAVSARARASTTTAKGRARGKARAESVEILVDARLKLNAGRRYALLGRNGSGKSTLLRAIHDKLIPGIPEETRIAILQQTKGEEEGGGEVCGKSVVEAVVDGVTARYEIEQEAKLLSRGINSEDAVETIRTFRTVQHERALKSLAARDKQARLRSGARGVKARQALISAEKEAKETEQRLKQEDSEISPEDIEREVQDAAFLLSDLQLQIEPARLSSIEASARKILSGLGFTETRMDQNVADLSGGWRMRAFLATALLQETDILILDEPTNYLDMLGIIWLQQHLVSLSAAAPDTAPTILIVSHDRAFISLCTDLLILRDKALTAFHGSLAAYTAATHDRRLWLLRMEDAQARQRAHMQQTIAANVRTGKAVGDDNRLRQAKARQRRLDDRMGMSVNARGGRFKLNRDRPGFHEAARAEIEVPKEDGPVVMALPEPAALRFPGALMALEGVGFRYANAGQAGSVLENVSLSVHMGDRVGILGLNGSGKSTLVKILVGQETPTRGTYTMHPRLKMGYFSQHAVDSLQALGRQDPSLTALSLVTRAMHDASPAKALDEGAIRGLFASLNLGGSGVSSVPLGSLSGGQLVRCALAQVLWDRPHVLVLDEVTTHLDYESVGALRECLRKWEGAVVLVSHDRWFVKGVVEGECGEDDDDREEDEEGGGKRGRTVYRMCKKTLVQLPRGVAEFEELMEKRGRRLLVRV
ncbi:hypothetical protein TD95_001054 [Thielaviopsis punctulata]|uniref:ABC transporter domain-containing protein n=1 Tax=Thielaviopsis punctulata TaxID=72032 RepID=A0A0F4Z9E5_9PEZI|nr:hypothetical protein TD95_001054 [Thielaviopsis punctulata]